MKSNLTFSRWLFSLLLMAFVWSGTAHAQSKPIKPDQNELSAIEETAVLFDQGQLTPNRDLRSPVCPSGNLSEGFEGTIFPPAGWKVINGGDANTWTRYTSTPITGTASAAIGYGSTAHNDWLISPRVVPQAGNATFSFMAKNGSSYFIEEFNVKLSTTGSEQADFTVTLASNVAPPTVATLYSYDLSAYNGQAVYIAVQAISTDEMRLYVDDFSGPALYAPYFASDGSVDFGVTFDLGSYSEDFEIANCSAGNLELDFLSASPEVTVTGLPLTIATGATGTITVNFNPSALGPYNGNFQLTTNDPENPTFQTTVVSTVKKAVVTTSIFENFDSYTGFSVPANWGGDFSTRTTGGLNNTARFTKNLWGTGSSMTGQFYTNFVDMADDGILSFSYRAVNYSSYPNTPTPAASFEFVVWISTDFGINFTPIYVCDATNHSPSTQYAFVEVDLSAYSGETAMFLIDAERFADDFYLDFDDFSVSFVQPGLQFMAAEVLMGERPIAAWMKPAALGIMNNPGKGSFTFGAVDLDNNYDGFLSAVNPALPFVLNEGDFTEEFGIRTNNTAVAPGAFSGSLAFFYEPTSTRAASVIPFSGFAYTPVNGDVWEKAFTVSSVTFPVTVAKGDFRDNYDLPGATADGWDVVYKIVVSANDMLADISLTGTDAKMAVYPANFGGLGGPDTDNALASATTSVTGLELYQGTYYLVVSATGANYTLNYTPTVMPSPVAVTNLTPADGAVNIINGNNLTWSWGTNTLDYRVVLGTTYPPATVVKDWATANTAVNGSYTLAGLNPNLQYFWRIDTRNNNGTTSGDVWGFTTTITPPSALAVTVNDPGESSTTVSASLTWTGPTNRAFIGYNVYRGGVKITPTPITNASFTDLGLARNTTYSYTVKSVYDEGESAASNTVSITTKGVGTFNGFVYDALTSAPIEGATVKITGASGDYTLTTTANGAYSTLAYKGSYNFTVSATDYNSQTVSNVSLNHGATVSRNFYLSETPFPVGEVIAFELNENSTQVSWSGIAPSPIELVKITQNPGLPENAYYEYFDMGYGVVYDLLSYPDASISSMNFHHASWGTFGTWQYKIHVYNWDTKTLIGTYGPFSTTGNDKWESGVNLGNVSAGGAGLVAIIMEPLGNVYDDAFPNLSSDDDVLNPQGSIFGELNDPAGMATSTIGNFLMELYIYTAQGTRESVPRYVDFGKTVNAPNRMNTTAEASKSVINQTSVSITKGEETFTNRTVSGPSYYTDATRGIVSYDVWREKAFQPGALVKIGNTFSEDFVDFDWGNMGWGVYRWGVTVNYDAGQVSALTYSNTLDKDMEIAVDVAVALNSSESPAGTSVTFTNTSEPDLELVYNTVLDNSGAFAWSEFRRGIYNIQVTLPGFAVVAETGVEIFDDASFAWLLEELLAAPGNLYVTPTAFATWNLGGGGGGGGGAFEPFMESFDGFANGEIPAGWTRSPDVVRWGVYSSSAAGGTSPEMRFYWSPSTTGEFSLMSPSMNTSGQTQLSLSFDNYLWHYSASYNYSVKVVAIADGVQHIIQEWNPVTANIPKGLLSYDLTAAHGVGASDFKIGWIFNGPTMGIYYWNFDNVMLNGSRSNANRSFEYSKVFLDGQLVTETTDNEYQYDVANLTPYETYTAGVAAVYSTGQSTTETFDFIYVPCGDYDTPTAFTAEQTIGTLDIVLNWTNVDAAALDTVAGVVLYRNGAEYAEIDFEDGVVASFTDGGLEFGTYNYCITYVYDSGAETCQGVVCTEDVVVTGGGYVNGTVTAFDGGAAIQGATVVVFNDDFSFEFTTDLSGHYEGEVIDGTYDYAVSAATYESQLLENVTITFGETVTTDFQLLEFPYPVETVIATELTDDAVQIDWGAQVPVVSEWLVYDNDVMGFTGIGAEVSNYSLTWASKFVPAQLTEYGTGFVTKVSVYQLPSVGDFLTEIRILGGENGETVLYSQDVTGTLTGNAWNVIELDQAVAFDNTENLWIAVYVERPGDTANEPTAGALQVLPNRYDYFAYNGGAWTSIGGEYGITDEAWMLRGFVTTSAGREVALGQGDYDADSYTDYSSKSVSSGKGMIAATKANAKFPVYANNSNRELVGYSVYRTTCETGDLTLLGVTLDDQFTDNTWGSMTSGMYKWGVVAEYDNNESEVVFSNCLDKDMLTTVSVTVTTNSGDSPEGTNVVFTNTSEPGLGLTYETQLDETGYFAWEEFRKGTYDIYAEKLGFEPVDISGYVIDSPENFVWLLHELLLPVSDLYVTPTAFATWRDGGVIPFEPFIEDFSAGIDNWTVTPATGNWQLSQTNLAGGTAPEARFYWSPNTTNRFYFISPMMSTLTQTEIEMSFDHFISDFSGGYTIQLVTIADGVEHEVMNFPASSIPATNVVTTLTTAHGVGAEEFQIGFVFDGTAFDINWWNIDNIMLYTPGTRELQSYKIWLDGIYVADTPNTFYQYDVTNLIEGQEYYSEVAAVYSNGISAKMDYTWTYYSCENYPGPDGLEAEVNGQDVTLNWSGTTPPPPPPGDGFEDDFEGHANFVIDFAPWTNVDVDGSTTYGMTGITWPNAYDPQSFIIYNPSATSPELPDVTAHSGSKFAACFAAVTAPNNDWLIAPKTAIGAGYNVNFWAKSYVADYGLERFKVGVSTTGTNPADFTIITPGSFVEAPASAWTEFSYDLSAYAGQEVYVGINCVSNDAFFLMVDDFSIGTQAASFAFNNAPAVVGTATRALPELPVVTNFDPAMAALLVDSKAFTGETTMNREVGVLWGDNWEEPQTTTQGIVSTYFGGLDAPTYSADDFTVPAGKEWVVSSLWARGFLSAGVPSPEGFGYTIFADANGAPGAVLYEEINAGANNPDQVEIDLDTPITLTEGTYWIAFYAYYQNATGTTQGRWNQYMWNPATTPGNPAMLNDIAGLFGGTGGFVTLTSLGVDFSSLDFAIVGESQDAGGGPGGDFDPGLLLGANVYRDGILIAEMVTDDFYVDENVDYGTYTYCVHYVYESGAESCSESCVEVEVEFPCDPPKQLAGQYLWTEEAWGSMIEWNGPQDAIAEWLFYDDGVNVDGIGGPATFIWAVKFDPAQLADLGGASLTKIMIYNRTNATDELRIYEGTNAATLLHSQPLSGLGIEVYEEVSLTSPVLLDVTKQLWIAVYTTDGANYPAGASNYAGNPNSDLITQDGGATWEHLNTLGLPYSWNLRGFVTTVAGATASLPMDKPVDQISNTGESFVVTGKPSAQAFFPDETSREGRELESFNVYRSLSNNNYQLVANVPFEEGVTAYSHFDTDVEAQVGYYYQVTAFYSYTNGTCESVPAMAVANPEDDFVFVFPTNTPEFSLNNTRVYPNPANNNVVIESAKMNRVTVMNALGQVVLDRAIEGQTRHDLNTSSYEAGIYLIRIETNEGVVTKRLTIVR